MDAKISPLEEISLRSEEVQDVLERIPPWMIRWGNTLFFFLILLLFLLSWLVKYPDVIPTEVTITTKTPPQKEYAMVTGKIDSVFVQNASMVQANTILAVMENTANTKDVFYLKSLLDTLTVSRKGFAFPLEEIPVLLLGEVETAFATFENAYLEYRLSTTLDPYSIRNRALEVSRTELQLRLQNLRSQHNLKEAQLELAQKDVERNRKLLQKGVISELDFERIQSNYLNAQQGLKALAVSISLARERLAEAGRNARDSEFSQTLEQTRQLRAALQALSALKKSIEDWELRYVFKADMNGQVAFMNVDGISQQVSPGDLVFTILPSDASEYIAELRASARNSGKIKAGQTVNVRLDNYPESEFGLLKGRVSSLTLTPDNEGYYLIKAQLPFKLTTTYGKQIDLTQEMKGQAEIVTEDLRLLHRFFNQLKGLFSN